MDLLPDEEEIFAALASKTRRDIKAAAKAGAFTVSSLTRRLPIG